MSEQGTTKDQLHITAVLVPAPALVVAGVPQVREEKTTDALHVAVAVAEFIEIAVQEGVFEQGGTVVLTVQPIKKATKQ